MSIIIRKHHRYQNYTYHNEKRLNVSAAASSNCIVHPRLTLKNVYLSCPEQVSLIHDPLLSSCLDRSCIYLLFCNSFIFNSFKLVNIKAWELGREAQNVFNFVYSLITLACKHI